MPEEFKPGCQRPRSGPVLTRLMATGVAEKAELREEKAVIQVGKKAPDFSAPAYQQGKFVEVKLSEYLGKWIILCFYPGDFTFV